MAKKLYKDFSDLGELQGKKKDKGFKETGTIKWFNSSKGFGFIKREEGDDVFIHSSELSEACIPEEGDIVEFNIKKGPKGLQASSVVIVKKPASNKKGVHNLYSIANTKLPDDTRKYLLEDRIDNFALKLNKTVNFINFEKGEEAILYKAEYKDKNNEKWKKFEIEFDFVLWNESIKRLKERTEKIKKSWQEMGGVIKNIEGLSIDWRLIIGLGTASVYETSMTLHHIYGIPYIPGQAVKGVLSNFIINEVFGENDNKVDLKDAEKRARKNVNFLRIFGSEERQGHVIFFDAFPTSAPTIKPDIMTVHYIDYYKEGSKVPPADYQNPIPIPFLTVQDAEFEFIIGVKKKHINDKVKIGDNEGSILKVTEEWLKDALTQHGIGAKTAVGYGYFENKAS